MSMFRLSSAGRLRWRSSITVANSDAPSQLRGTELDLGARKRYHPAAGSPVLYMGFGQDVPPWAGCGWALWICSVGFTTITVVDRGWSRQRMGKFCVGWMLIDLIGEVVFLCTGMDDFYGPSRSGSSMFRSSGRS
jgi:hypothetical protein